MKTHAHSHRGTGILPVTPGFQPESGNAVGSLRAGSPRRQAGCLSHYFARYTLALFLAITAFASSARAQDDPLIRERDQQTGTAITILFDNSGSMKGDKIKQAKSGFRSWLQTVPADYKFSLITFEDNGRLTIPMGEKTRDLVAQRVAQLEARTSTPICGALRIARQQIEKRRREVTPYERHVVLLFTDGAESMDKRGNEGVREDISALRKETVEVVGVGFHGEGDYMRDVSTRFALANNEAELKQGLAKVDAEVGSVDDLVVSAEDLAALKGFNAAPVKAVAAVPAEAAAESDPATAPSAPQKKGFKMPWFVIGIIAFFLLRRLFIQPKRKK